MVVFTSFSPPVDGVIHQQPSTRAFVNDHELGTGTLYITESALIWGGEASTARSLSLQYRRISLHAVQREPTPSLYMLLDYELRLPELGNDTTGGGDTAEEEHSFDPDNMPLTELRFVPPTEDLLPVMFQAMGHCQTLHPDPEEHDSDNEQYYNDEDMEDEEEEFEDALESNGAATGAGDEAAVRMRGLRLEQPCHAPQPSNGQAPRDDDGEDYESDQFLDN